MTKSTDEQKLKDIRSAYILAKALNTQYIFIREFLNPELAKAASNAKAANSFFIKQIDFYFKKHKVSKEFLEEEDELSFKILEIFENLKENLPDNP